MRWRWSVLFTLACVCGNVSGLSTCSSFFNRLAAWRHLADPGTTLRGLLKYSNLALQKPSRHAPWRQWTMMPEGPECKRTADQLHNYCSGWALSKVEVLSGRYITHGPPKGFDEFQSNILPATIDSVDCKGKFIYFLCSSPSGQNASIWSTLGMSGRWAEEQTQHSRVRFTLSSRSAPDSRTSVSPLQSSTDVRKVLYLTDARNFGTLTFCGDNAQLEDKLASLGPAYLSGEVQAEAFLELARKNNNKYLAVFLMDQSKTSGVGNYILSEALFRAMVDPFLKVCEVSDEALLRVYASVVEVIEASYAASGVSRGAANAAPPIGMFRGLDGDAGNYGAQLQVYGKARCPKGAVVKRAVGPHKRAIWYVDRYITPQGAANRRQLGLEEEEEETRQYLNVSFAEKDEAKKLGAKWDAGAKKWYRPPGVSAQLFSKWL